MHITRLNPERLHEPSGYAHVTIVNGGCRLVFLAGQCPVNRDRYIVGHGDVLAQVDQVVANGHEALGAASASPEDVVRSVVYVVSDDPSVLPVVWDRFSTSSLRAAFTTASTLVGVAALGYEGQLVEVDLTAALSG